LSENEIAAAAKAYPVIGPSRVFNPQQQVPMTWPAVPEVARAYIDQLLRDKSITEDDAERLGDMLDQVKQAMEYGGDKRLARQINNYRLSIKGSYVDSMTRNRIEKLKSILKGIATDLRG
jgi:hypothetical protein